MFWGRTHQFAFCIVPTVSERLAVDALLLYTEFSALVHRHSIEFQDFPKVHFFSLHKFEVINIFSCRQKIIYCRSEKKWKYNTRIQTNPIKNTTRQANKRKPALIPQRMLICSATCIGIHEREEQLNVIENSYRFVGFKQFT